MINLELSELQQAQSYFQKAFNIWSNDGERFFSAFPYLNLGILAEELAEFEQAKNYYLQALGIFAEFEDQPNGSLAISKLAGLHDKTQDNTILTEVAAMLDSTEAEIRELFDRFTQVSN